MTHHARLARIAALLADLDMRTAAVAEDEHATYILGGTRLDDGRPVATAFRYDHARDAIDPLPHLPQPRSEATAVVARGRICAVGGTGRDGGGRADAVVYHVAEETWTTAALRQPRRRAGACAIGNAVYIVGGVDDRRTLASAERLDLTTAFSLPIAPLRIARGEPGVVGLADGHVLVVGGWVKDNDEQPIPLDSVEEYDPTTNTWFERASMPEARSGVRARLTAEGRVRVTGGQVLRLEVAGLSYVDVDEPDDRGEEYIPSHNVWTHDGILTGVTTVAALFLACPHCDHRVVDQTGSALIGAETTLRNGQVLTCAACAADFRVPPAVSRLPRVASA
jgi:hypothetical protein